MSMYCRFCGKQIENDSRYCKYCGKKLKKKRWRKDTQNLQKDTIYTIRNGYSYPDYLPDDDGVVG